MAKFPVDSLTASVPVMSGTGSRQRWIKRCFDIVYCCIVLIMLAPVLASVSLGIRLSSPGPILYRARRVGRDGTLFTMYKFRTMHHCDSCGASVITAQHDPRVFALGEWLRLLKLDELPQLFNILKGDMSLVGPRPEDPLIVERYFTQDELETLRVLPGLASPGSIFNYTHGEEILGEGDAEEAYVQRLLPIKLALDRIYVREASFAYDLRIMARTIYTVLAVSAGKRHFPDPPEMEQASRLIPVDLDAPQREKVSSTPDMTGVMHRRPATNGRVLSESEIATLSGSAQVREQFLPFALPDIDERELNEIREVLDAGWITTGPKTRQFEQAFADAVGATHAVAVNSCTAAMHLALEAIGVQPGDYVFTSPYTFAATAEVIRYFNATPVFVDIDPDTLNIDAKLLAKTVEDLKHCLDSNQAPQTTAVRRAFGARQRSPVSSPGRVRAIIPVHFAGLPVAMDPIYAVAAEHDLAVIEDAAHAFPAKYREWHIGQDFVSGVKSKVPSLKCYSFYSTKTITTGEGGMICTSDEVLAERCRMMSLHGISKDAWKRYTAEGSWYYEIVAPGYKYNLTDIASAMGLAQLTKSERMWKRRRKIAEHYNEVFDTMPALQVPTDLPDCQHAWHLYPLRLNLGMLSISRNQFIEELKAQNIGTSVHFIPIHLHPYYREMYGFQPEDFPTACNEFQRIVSLPIYSRMSDRDVDDVVNAVAKVVEQCQIIQKV